MNRARDSAGEDIGGIRIFAKVGVIYDGGKDIAGKLNPNLVCTHCPCRNVFAPNIFTLMSAHTEICNFVLMRIQIYMT